MAALKNQDKESEDVVQGEVMSTFRGYDLDKLGLPQCARPRSGNNYMGRHGYTLKSPTGAAT